MAQATLPENGNSNNPVSVEALPALTYREQPVITTDVLATAFGVKAKQLHDNFKNNRPRFVEGKHFFKVEGEELRTIKNYPALIGLVQNHARHLVLYTGRGSARHAKMLGTDSAWDIQDKLEDNYFSKVETQPEPSALPAPARLTTGKERSPLAVLVNRYLGMGTPSKTAYMQFWTKTFHPVFGIGSVEELTIDQLPRAVAFMEAILKARGALPAGEQPKALPEPEPEGFSAHTNPHKPLPLRAIYDEFSTLMSTTRKAEAAIFNRSCQIGRIRVDNSLKQHTTEHHLLDTVGTMTRTGAKMIEEGMSLIYAAGEYTEALITMGKDRK